MLSVVVPAAAARSLGLAVSRETHALDLLRRPEMDYATLTTVPELGPAVEDAEVAMQVEVQAKYAGYLERQREDRKLAHYELRNRIDQQQEALLDRAQQALAVSSTRYS